MKVYVIKNEQGQYQTPDISFISSIWQSDLFNDYEVAKCYCQRDCKIIECELLEKTELSDYTKQVRKEVCEEIRAIFSKVYRECNSQRAMWDKFFSELDQIKGDRQ